MVHKFRVLHLVLLPTEHDKNLLYWIKLIFFLHSNFIHTSVITKQLFRKKRFCLKKWPCETLKKLSHTDLECKNPCIFFSFFHLLLFYIFSLINALGCVDIRLGHSSGALIRRKYNVAQNENEKKMLDLELIC